MKRLKIYFIDDEYINYLRMYDKKVAYNKSPRRPYVGVVFIYNNFYYFAPLSSPKPKHINMKKTAVDIFKIADGKLGIINLNNMIPCSPNVLTEAIQVITNKKYKILLENQLNYLNANREKLYKRTNSFQQKYRKGYLENNILDRCCNFPLLEEKCLEYIEDQNKEM